MEAGEVGEGVGAGVTAKTIEDWEHVRFPFVEDCVKAGLEAGAATMSGAGTCTGAGSELTVGRVKLVESSRLM